MKIIHCYWLLPSDIYSSIIYAVAQCPAVIVCLSHAGDQVTLPRTLSADISRHFSLAVLTVSYMCLVDMLACCHFCQQRISGPYVILRCINFLNNNNNNNSNNCIEMSEHIITQPTPWKSINCSFLIPFSWRKSSWVTLNRCQIHVVWENFATFDY